MDGQWIYDIRWYVERFSTSPTVPGRSTSKCHSSDFSYSLRLHDSLTVNSATHGIRLPNTSTVNSMSSFRPYWSDVEDCRVLVAVFPCAFDRHSFCFYLRNVALWLRQPIPLKLLVIFPIQFRWGCSNCCQILIATVFSIGCSRICNFSFAKCYNWNRFFTYTNIPESAIIDKFTIYKFIFYFVVMNFTGKRKINSMCADCACVKRVTF